MNPLMDISKYGLQKGRNEPDIVESKYMTGVVVVIWSK